jgi:hypothetical protein
MAASSTSVSGLSSRISSARASRAARLFALAKPWFSPLAISRMPGKAAAIASAEPSVEALSTTISSKGIMVWATTLRRQSSVISRVL